MGSGRRESGYIYKTEKNKRLKDMLDITTVILTYNEEIHIGRCLKNIYELSKRIVVVDSPSTDRTVEICKEFPKVDVFIHKYPGNQAEQFNWALDNCNINTQWILRLDADEYLTDELICEINEIIPGLSSDISAIVFPLGRAFMGKLLRHEEVNYMIRLFRTGKARYGTSLMDEHLIVDNGKTIAFNNKFIDDNRNSLSFFLEKHIKYADREAIQSLTAEYLTSDRENGGGFCDEVKSVKGKKDKYAKMPLFWRAFVYFCYRYFVRLSILDGKEGFLWCFLQGWWYRTVVDAKIMEIKRKCEYNKEKIIKYIEMNNVYKNK